MRDKDKLTARAGRGGEGVMMEKHFVTFYSPGTFVSETTTKPIDSWSVGLAVEMAHGIMERHGATPYGFRFSTRARDDSELDSQEVASSNFYYLGGKVETLAEIEQRDDPSESVLRGNMRGNGWDKVVINTNSYHWTQPLKDGDVVLDFEPRVRTKNTVEG